MRNKGSRLFVMLGVGSSFLRYSFDEDRDELTVTCPVCRCTGVTPCHPEPGQDGPTLQHEWDCRLLRLIESFENHGGTVDANWRDSTESTTEEDKAETASAPPAEAPSRGTAARQTATATTARGWC